MNAREVLVFPRDVFPFLPGAGAWSHDGWPTDASWCPREDAENDERWLQAIPYVLLQDHQSNLWCYRRGGGEARLAGRMSCGVGGHVERADAIGGDLAATVAAAARRELAEELVAHGIVPEPPTAWIYEGESAVGRVHIGVLSVARWPGPGIPVVREPGKLTGLGFVRPGDIASDPGFERWSRLAANWFWESTG